MGRSAGPLHHPGNDRSNELILCQPLGLTCPAMPGTLVALH